MHFGWRHPITELKFCYYAITSRQKLKKTLKKHTLQSTGKINLLLNFVAKFNSTAFFSTAKTLFYLIYVTTAAKAYGYYSIKKYLWDQTDVNNMIFQLILNLSYKSYKKESRGLLHYLRLQCLSYIEDVV